MPQLNLDKAAWDQSGGDARTPQAVLAFQALHPADDADSWGDSRRDAGVRLFHESDNTDAKLAKLTEGLVPFPEVGQEFLGRFRLIGELGRGAFGRVYLARDRDLADRLVALKLTTDGRAESQKLARLQHTNIVPVYFIDRSGPLQAVVMPYCGPTTLADVIDDLGRRDTLPASGKGLVSTLHSHRGKSGVVPVVHPTPAAVAPTALAQGRAAAPSIDAGPPAALTTLRMLEGLSYVEAVLWIGGRLAEGLAHAHERGILHRDLKPANVLLTDEGQPMLLDFNLAEDVKTARATGARVGGTLPYMAPEHLAAYQGRPVDVDARSDLYALGVILYELLAGRHPFGRTPGAYVPGSPEALEKMTKDRLRPPPPARKFNAGVTPAVDSILRRCLEPSPARRYQTAAELREDLDRQRLHQPLRYAAEPSLRERAAKWLRRHPRTITAARVWTAAGVLVAVLTVWLCWRGEELARHESADRLRGFHEDLASARLLLSARAADVDDLDAGRDAAQRALKRYGVGADDHWRDEPSVRRLPADEKDRLQAESGELLILLASATARKTNGEQGGVSPRSNLEEALRMNRLAETCYPHGQAPRALWSQRAWLEKKAGHDDEAAQLQERADATPVRDAGDEYLLARDQAGAGRMADAVERLRTVAAREPNNFAVQFLMGNCCLDGYIDRLGQEADAVGCYSACIALRPDFHAAYANRGLIRLRRFQYAEAEADFGRAIELRPNSAGYYVHRAQARMGQRNNQGAVDDLDQAEEFGSKEVVLYYLRAAARQRLGQDVSARRDLDAVLRMTPADEDGFVARGLALASDGKIEAALADFKEAVNRNPNSAPGLQDEASMLAEQLGRNEEALAPLDRLLDLYPAYARARGARAVVRARLGQRDGALEDVKKARELDPESGGILHQAACVYALVGRGAAERAEAFRLLCQALQKGSGWDDLDAAGDLAPLRKDPRFEELRQAAGLLRRGSQ